MERSSGAVRTACDIQIEGSGGRALALESQTSINKLEAPSAYQRSSKCMKLSKKKINFIKTVFVSISLNGVSIYTYRNKQCLYKIDFFDVFYAF